MAASSAVPSRPMMKTSVTLMPSCASWAPISGRPSASVATKWLFQLPSTASPLVMSRIVMAFPPGRLIVERPGHGQWHRLMFSTIHRHHQWL
jgi:hypothetical protein